MVAEVRQAREDETGRIADLLSRAAFGPTVSRLVAFPRTSPHGDVLVADHRGDPQGAVCCVSFGATGWIGALGVAPEARRRGLGRALTEAAIARLHARGAATVLLFATDMGRPLYEHLGFVTDGSATAWRGIAGVPVAGDPVRRLREDDRAAVARLDRAATGEDRAPMLDTLRPAQRPRRRARRRAGGLGRTRALRRRHRDLRRRRRRGRRAAGGRRERPEAATLVVPDANAGAAAALRRWGFRASNAGDRMRLGPPVAWRPERQFGLFNLFWG